MMINLRKLELQRTYCSTSSDIYKDLVVPLLCNSARYDRAVGFFSSSWIIEVASGLRQFVLNKGIARIATSVRLSERDWEAIRSGAEDPGAEEIISYKVNEVLNDLKINFQYDSLGALSWLVSNAVLDFRFCMPVGKLGGGILHSKLSVFYDVEGNGVAIMGSQNDSSQASINEETVSVFTSWGSSKEYFFDYEKSFSEKWNGDNKTIKSYAISDAIKENIIEAGREFQNNFVVGLKECAQPRYSKRILRTYQKSAIHSWIDNNKKGLFEMATGSGKTFTAISAVKHVLEEEKPIAIVILAPRTHLVVQWEEELDKEGIRSLRCIEDHTKWKNAVSHGILELKAGLVDYLCLISTPDTASSENFRKFIQRLPKPWILVADEVHGLGSKHFRKALFEEADYRIGLSATPSRWFDDEGTQIIKNYFSTTVIKYGLKEAIEDGALTKYSYEPIFVELTLEELDEYTKLTKMISKLIQSTDVDDERLKTLLRKRASLVGCAKNKVKKLCELVTKHQREYRNEGYKFNLYYCNPGEHRKVVLALASCDLKVHKFVDDVSREQRRELLKAFEGGSLDGLVAIKCLDEGVDIPATQRAYILASTSNPREFIQRRGRILRKFPGKKEATIYDFVIGPWGYENEYEDDIAKSLLRRELPRITEFNDLSTTKYSKTEELFDYCRRYGLEDCLYMKPWEIYKSLEERDRH